MMAKLVFFDGDRPIAEFPIQIETEGDMAEGAKEAFAEFRRSFPAISIYDVSTKFLKIDEPSGGTDAFGI